MKYTIHKRKKRELTFQDKINHAVDLASILCYKNNGSSKDTSQYGKETSDLLWAYTDGLIQKYHENRIQGKCSLRGLIDYDTEKEETKVNKHISLFKKLIEAVR